MTQTKIVVRVAHLRHIEIGVPQPPGSSYGTKTIHYKTVRCIRCISFSGAKLMLFLSIHKWGCSCTKVNSYLQVNERTSS